MIDDVIVVGSGASAVHAVYSLVEAGLKVRMLDFGNEEQVYSRIIPQESFLEIRRKDPHQYRYFLGERFEGVPIGELQKSLPLTPPRQYIIKDTQSLTPIDSRTPFFITSLALGGMASGWGAGAMSYNDEELKDFPITYEDLRPHYEKVAERIGVSGEKDDLFAYDGELKAMLPPLQIDPGAQAILGRYSRHREKFNKAGFYMGKPRLAALSRPYRGRGPDRYLDMSFWSDADQSVWRPRYTLTELRSFPNFIYHRCLVQTFGESRDGSVEVTSKNAAGQVESHRARKLILAAGVFGTARIVLRSLNKYGMKVPFVCGSYTYYPMLNINRLGQTQSEKSHSLAQLCVVYDTPSPEQTLIHGRVHSYRSLLNFKIIQRIPLPYREGIRAVKMLLPCLVILALDHEDRPGPDKYCVLHPSHTDAPDHLEVTYSLSDEVKKQQRWREKVVLRHFRRLGCFALKRVWPGDGASLRYGGTFPMSREEREFTVDPQGRLRGTRSVYITDCSVFPYIPAKGLTFTMMANANRIGESVRQEFKQ